MAEEAKNPRSLAAEKVCPACNESYTDRNLVVCPRDRTMLLTPRMTDSWRRSVRSGERKHCRQCRGSFEISQTICPNDGGVLEMYDGAVGETALLEERFRPIEFVRDEPLFSLYSAIDEQEKRWVVIKLLRRELSCDEKTVSRFLKFAGPTRDLHHPNIIKIHSVNVTPEGDPYLISEYHSFKSLDQMTAGPVSLTPLYMVQIFSDVCRALQYAHERNFFHGSLTPKNIYADTSAAPAKGFIADFGVHERQLRGVQWDGPSFETHTVNLYGDATSAAPELSAGKAPSAQSDIYQLGCAMYLTACGQSPFKREKDLEVILAHMTDAPDQTLQLAKHVPNEWKAVIYKCLSKLPEDRYKTAEELRTVLEALPH